MSNKSPVGMFRAVVRENNGTVHEQLKTDLVFELSETGLNAGGFEFVDHDGQRIYWGIDVSIHDEPIRAKTYPFAPRGRISGFFNPPRPQSSWVPDETNPVGEITLVEVDHKKKFAHGTFKFTVFNRHVPGESAQVTGAFSLTAAT